ATDLRVTEFIGRNAGSPWSKAHGLRCSAAAFSAKNSSSAGAAQVPGYNGVDSRAVSCANAETGEKHEATFTARGGGFDVCCGLSFCGDRPASPHSPRNHCAAPGSYCHGHV